MASENVTILSDDTFSDTIAADGEPVLVDFWAEWCGPCKMISPIYDQLSTTYPNINFAKVDVDDLDDTAAAAGIKSMPTFQAHVNGTPQPSLQFSGADASRLEALVKTLNGM